MSRSEQLGDLFSALAKAQSEMDSAGKSSSNPFFKNRYADLAEIVKSSRPALVKHGLSVMQQILPNENGQHVLHTLLCHSSGQWCESRMIITPVKNDIQSLGSCISYLRRYCYAALVGVIVCDDSDDDGEADAAPMRHAPQNREPNPSDSITPEQHVMLEEELRGHEDIKKEILEKLMLTNLSQMTKGRFAPAMRRIREIKDLQKK